MFANVLFASRGYVLFLDLYPSLLDPTSCTKVHLLNYLFSKPWPDEFVPKIDQLFVLLMFTYKFAPFALANSHSAISKFLQILHQLG